MGPCGFVEERLGLRERVSGVRHRHRRWHSGLVDISPWLLTCCGEKSRCACPDSAPSPLTLTIAQRTLVRAKSSRTQFFNKAGACPCYETASGVRPANQLFLLAGWQAIHANDVAFLRREESVIWTAIRY